MSIPKLIHTRDGIKLDQSILWFDAKQSAELSFLSSALNHNKYPRSQVITTEETAKILDSKSKGVNALVCQYNRPFSVGKLKMELLPSGSVLGGASLYVESDHERILYAPSLQSQKIMTLRQMQLKKAHILILGAMVDPSRSYQQGHNRKREKEALIQFVREQVSTGQYPLIFCNALSVAQEVTKALTEEGLRVACHPSIHRFNKIYEHFGAKLGKYKVSAKFQKDTIMLFPNDGRYRRLVQQCGEKKPSVLIDDGMHFGISPVPLFSNQKVFRLSTLCEAREFKDIIHAVSPRVIYVFGPFTKNYVKEIGAYFKNVQPLYENDQPTLF